MTMTKHTVSRRASRLSHIFTAGARNAKDDDTAIERNAWETPWPVVHALAMLAFNDRAGFDVDVAASARNAKAPSWFTKDDDGLERWPYLEPCTRTWCNPPWSEMRTWLDAAAGNSTIAVVLGPLNDTTVRWCLQHPRVPWCVVGSSRLGYIDPTTGLQIRQAGQASIAWFFNVPVPLPLHGFELSDEEIGELAKKFGDQTAGLPLFGR